MKKFLLSAAALLMCVAGVANAQEPTRTPEDNMQKRAEGIAAKLLLSDQATAKFVPTYVEYLKSMKGINEQYKPAKPQGNVKTKKTDKEIEASLRAQLSKSQDILDLRKAYLDKYLKIMSARQVRELYKIEKEQAAHHGKKCDAGKPEGMCKDGKCHQGKPEGKCHEGQCQQGKCHEGKASR